MAIEAPLGASGRTAREVVEAAARAVGKTLRERFSTDHTIEYRGRNNIVTETDLLAEEQILADLRREFPNFGVLAEESGRSESDSSYTWVIDPLDGTRNYASAIPHFGVVIALAKDDHVFLGVTYDPMRDELFLAEEGHGATLNGVPMKVSSEESLEKCIVGGDLGYRDDLGGYALDLSRSLWPKVQGIRIMGSAALGLAWAAAGRYDLYFHQSLYPWDIASGLILAQESGAVILDLQGNPATLDSDRSITSSPRLAAEFMERASGSAWLNS